MFEKCQIIVSSESEKEELLKGCKHIHDFTVWFHDLRKILENFKIEVNDEFGLKREMDKGACGVSLNFDEYPFVNFLAGLYDCEDKSVREKYIKVLKENAHTATWRNVKKAQEVIEKVKGEKSSG